LGNTKHLRKDYLGKSVANNAFPLSKEG